MPVYNLLLDSSLAKQQRNGDRQVSHDFTIEFQAPIRLGPGNYKAALDQLITVSYSWYSIDEAYDNNKIRWRKKTGSWKTLVFPNEMYDYADINSFLQAQTGKVGSKDKSSYNNMLSGSTQPTPHRLSQSYPLSSVIKFFPVYFLSFILYSLFQDSLKIHFYIT